MIADYFIVGVPLAKSLDPENELGRNRRGVRREVPAADALATAEKLAMEQIQAKKASK